MSNVSTERTLSPRATVDESLGDEDIVAVVSHCHELGEGRVPEDGIVRQANVGDVKVDELSAVVVALAEGDMEVNLL